MIVYSLPRLIVFRQVLRLLRRETLLTNKPVFLLFLKYCPLKGLHYPDVRRKSVFSQERAVRFWLNAPLIRRWSVCNPKWASTISGGRTGSAEPFLGSHSACAGSCKTFCKYEQQITWADFSQFSQDTCFVNPGVLCFQTKAQSLLPSFHQGSLMPRLCKRQQDAARVL